MVISAQLYNEIVHSFQPVPPENGGILGHVKNEVCAFCMDCANMVMERNCYKPNVAFLNEAVNKWSERGIAFAGIVHSHPSNQRELSSADKKYIREILNALKYDYESLFFPLVFPGVKMISYIAYRDNNEIVIKPDEITIL